MKCPVCEHVSDKALLRCSECDSTFDRVDLEQLEHLLFIARWLESKPISLAAHEALLAQLEGEIGLARQALGIEALVQQYEETQRPAEEIGRQLTLLHRVKMYVSNWSQSGVVSGRAADSLSKTLDDDIRVLQKALRGRSYQTINLPEIVVIDFALDALPGWSQRGQWGVVESGQVRAWLERRKNQMLGPSTRPVPEPLEEPGPAPIVDSKRPLATINKETDLLIRIKALVGEWQEAEVIWPGLAATLERHIASQIKALDAERGDRPLIAGKVNKAEVYDFALNNLDDWSKAVLMSQTEELWLREHLLEQKNKALGVEMAAAREDIKAPVTERPARRLREPVARPATRVAPKRPPIPRPKLPEISLSIIRRKLSEAAASGALLGGFLYLNAFAIVVAAAVLVIRFPDRFPEWAQIGFIALGPLAFYIFGWIIRVKIGLRQSGSVLTNIGSLLVAVDLAAIYIFGNLQESINSWLYWLAASVFCTSLYIFTAWRLPTEFVGYTFLAGMGSTMVSASLVIGLHPQWAVVAAALSAAFMLLIGLWLERRSETWQELTLASRRLPAIVLPFSQAFALFVPGEVAWSQAAVFGVATASYALLVRVHAGRRWPGTIFTHATVWSSVAALGFALVAADTPSRWIGSVAATLSIAYLAVGRWLDQRTPAAHPDRFHRLLVPYAVGFGLLGLGLFLGTEPLLTNNFVPDNEFWPAIVALLIATAVLIGNAPLFRRPAFLFLGCGFFYFPFSAIATRWMVAGQVQGTAVWLVAVWSCLSLLYLVLAVLLRRFREYTRYLFILVHLMVPVSAIILAANQGANRGSWTPGPTLLALSGILTVYVASAVIQDSKRHPVLNDLAALFVSPLKETLFLWPIVALLPFWVLLVGQVTGLERPWLGLALAGTSLVYVLAGQGLKRREPAYSLPTHVAAYPTGAAGIVLALGHSWPLLLATLTVVATLAFLAHYHRRVVETSAAAVLFIWPFHLGLQLSPLPVHAYTLAYALLGSIAYLVIGLALSPSQFRNPWGVNRLETRQGKGTIHSLAVWFVGYGLVGLAVGASLLSRFELYPERLPWIDVAVPLLTSALMIFSVFHFRRIAFAWSGVALGALAYGQALNLLQVPADYDATAWVVLALILLVAERFLERKASESWLATFRWPFGVAALVTWYLGLTLTAPDTIRALQGREMAGYEHLILAQALATVAAIGAGRLYRSRWPLFIEPVVAWFPVTLGFMAYGQQLFGQALSTNQYSLVWIVLAIIHLLAAYWLDGSKTRYSHGLYLGGYSLTLLAAFWSIPERPVLLWSLGASLLIAVISAHTVHRRRLFSWDDLVNLLLQQRQTLARKLLRGAFLWFAAWLGPIWAVLLLAQAGLTDNFYWLGLAVPALAYLALIPWLRRVEGSYAWPFTSAAQAFTAAGLGISSAMTARFFSGGADLPAENAPATAYIVLQSVAVLFYVIAAPLYRRRFFAHLASWLMFAPFTLAWIVYAPELKTVQFAWPWLGLAVALLIAGYLLDGRTLFRIPAQRLIATRYAHGPYLAGYILALFALVWAIGDRLVLVWVLGLSLPLSILSAYLVHSGRHRSWSDLRRLLVGETKGLPRKLLGGAFLWFAAWLSPIWSVLFLAQVGLVDKFYWLGLAVPTIMYLGLIPWLRRVRGSYAWPFTTSAQVFIATGLLISVPLTARFFNGGAELPAENAPATAYIALQSAAVLFYYVSAPLYKRRFFSHLASWLIFAPFTLAWIVYAPNLGTVQFAWPWLGLAVTMLVAGYLLDGRKLFRIPAQRLIATRYAHGPYLAGYMLAIFAVLWSAGDRLVNIVTLGTALLMAAFSQFLLHRGNHRSYGDFLDLLWRRPGTIARRVATILFLIFAAYGFPIWLAQVTRHMELSLAWRGTALTLSAPLYVALGLWLRRFKREYTWPLYSVGYLLTAIGAMVAIDDERLFIAVLSLNTAVYAASAYIFRQPYWLYLSNVLAPVVVVLTLHYNDMLTAPWVAGSLMGLSFVYLGAGHLLNRTRPAGKGIWEYALPFLAIGYLISAVALAVGSEGRETALVIYSAGAILYGLSAWIFRESLFLYPAAWLAAVPYVLALTYLNVGTSWLGPLLVPGILAYTAIGRWAFKQRAFPLGNWASFLQSSLTPAAPFYFAAYGGSVAAMIVAAPEALPMTVALVTIAAFYFATSYLFKRAAWLYPALLVAHLSVLFAAQISPSGSPVYYISLPFLPVTWLVAMIGAFMARRFPPPRLIRIEAHQFRLQGRSFQLRKLNVRIGNLDVEIGGWPCITRLLSPSWAQPFLLTAAIDIVLWQGVAMMGSDTALMVGLGFAALLALLASIWGDGFLVYGAVLFLLLALGPWLASYENIHAPDLLAIFGGVGLALYLIGRLTDIGRYWAGFLEIWARPLQRSAVLLSLAAVIGTIPGVANHTLATAGALGFAGGLYLAIAYRGRYASLGYVAVAMLEMAWILLLVYRNVDQPQLYAVPAGLYFLGIGYLERRQGRRNFANYLDAFGASILLLTTFVQSLNLQAGFPYFVMLIIESLLILGWGAVRRVKVPFFGGMFAFGMNVVGQLIVVSIVNDVMRWIIILVAAVMATATVVLLQWESKRQFGHLKEWREMLEEWR